MSVVANSRRGKWTTFSPAPAIAKRVYALARYTVIYNVSGWYFKRTDYNDDWRGPYLCWHGVR